jgi:D-serine deaminase-like pyridoxal phosphate-dependent protein
LWASHGPRAVAGEPVVSSPSATSAIGRDPDWSAVLGALDSQRDRAFIDADAGELDAVYTPASPALAADRATLAQLVAAGEHAQGLALGLTSVVVSSRTDAQVSILVDDVLPAYDIVGPTGAMTRVAARGQRSWLVVLAAPTAPAATADLGWRIASITSTR